MMTKAAAIVVLSLSFLSFVGWLSGATNDPDEPVAVSSESSQ